MMVCVGSTPEKISGLPLEALPFFLGSCGKARSEDGLGELGCLSAVRLHCTHYLDTEPLRL